MANANLADNEKGADVKLNLPQIRLLEAAGFRSFPSTTTRYDGTWAIRMTAGHPAKRLNSVNPLDPGDNKDIQQRIALAAERFRSFGRPLLFRLTPLAPERLRERLITQGWQSFEESLVMMADLAAIGFEDVRDQVPLQDHGKWADAYLKLSEEPPEIKPGLVEIIGKTEPEVGLFVQSTNDSGEPVSVVRCVKENSLCGIFDLATDIHQRRSGHGRRILMTALKWARQRGVRRAWLQVVASNDAAIALYESVGFREVYRYSYWRADETRGLAENGPRTEETTIGH